MVNKCGYIAGHGEETDTELRQSYADKIFNRSANMLESIRSAILQNVLGVRSVAPYENPTHHWDEQGRPPHSIEIVVDGGDAQQIAQQILKNKAGGINTFGQQAVELPGAYDEPITIRFNRPTRVYVWFRVAVTIGDYGKLAPNYAEILREEILGRMTGLQAGEDVIPQMFVSDLHEACTGLSYIDIRLFSTTDRQATPTQYPDRQAEIKFRELAVTSDTMIEVVIEGASNV